MNDLKVYVKCFGCQMNKLDSELIASALKDAGYALTDTAKRADVVVINTCSVREHAEARAFSHLGHLKHLKKHRPHVVVAVVGCMAQRLGHQLLEHEAVDVVCGPNQIARITELLDRAVGGGGEAVDLVDVVDDAHSVHRATGRERPPRPGRPPRPLGDDLERFEALYGADGTAAKRLPGQAFVRVMRGCNNFCTYCIVPYVRGAEVCRPPAAILEQVRKLADGGIRQVTLLGQTVNSYEYAAGGKTWSLADLLYAVAEVKGIEWVRFVTSYPSDKYYDEILRAMAGSPKVCPSLHMPAQSGSDRILRAMNRHYSAAHYLELLDRARAIVPDFAAAGDFIVGFPGEEEEDFAATVDLVRQARYRNCFVFRYSPRPGTTADRRLADTVPEETKQRRNTELLAIQEQVSGELSAAFLGKRIRVLVEGPSKKAGVNAAGVPGQTQLVGRTATDHIVVFDGPTSLAGEFAEVYIARTAPLTLFGELCGEPRS